MRQLGKHLFTVNGERCDDVVQAKVFREFKLRAVRQVEAGASVAAVARRYEIHPTLLSKWRQQLRRDPERAFQRDRLQQHGIRISMSRGWRVRRSPAPFT